MFCNVEMLLDCIIKLPASHSVYGQKVTHIHFCVKRKSDAHPPAKHIMDVKKKRFMLGNWQEATSYQKRP
jgi:hypothetical protein